MADLKGIAENLIEGNQNKVRDLVLGAVDEGIEPQRILDEGLIAGMEVVGARFKKAKILVGGAPLTQSYADKIGADGYAPDVATAVEVAIRFIQG